MMYQTISKRDTIYHMYSEKLVKEGIVTEDQVKEIWNNCNTKIS